MDTSATDIIFDNEGHCNFCTSLLKNLQNLNKKNYDSMAVRETLHYRIKKNGFGKAYDCIVGLSGGVDSSYALHLAVKNGLRPLAVHLDNGWNSELAQKNIEGLVRKLNVNLHTHVIDWSENKNLQLSFLKAGVIDIEMIMDNAQAATNYYQAKKNGVKDILSGTNTATEGMGVSKNWSHYKFDKVNIKSIHRRFGSGTIKSHPLMGTIDWIIYEYLKKIRWHKYLDYFDYKREEAILLLAEEYGYKSYPYKHGESTFTKFYQNYLLPVKFGIDKRRAHFSNAICSNQMTRHEALIELQNNSYIDSLEGKKDKIYALKKLGLTEEEFNIYMQSPEVPHLAYGSEVWLLNTLIKLNNIYKKIK
jgi:N-acetyl sugar amidotransferase